MSVLVKLLSKHHNPGKVLCENSITFFCPGIVEEIAHNLGIRPSYISWKSDQRNLLNNRKQNVN